MNYRFYFRPEIIKIDSKWSEYISLTVFMVSASRKTKGDPGADALAEFIADCAEISDVEVLWKNARNFFRSFGVRRTIYIHLPPIGMPDLGGVEVFARGCAPDWDQSYVTQLHHREDLVLAHALRQADPVALSEIYRSNGATETQRGVLGGYRESGFGNGLAVPVFGPGGRNGCVILGFGNSRRAASGDAAPEASQVASLQVACQAAHLRHCKLRREMRPPPPSLSNRERELLMWVAQGKSNGVIAEIMQISPHTVDAYMRRVFLKLGAADRVSAVLRSVAETLIVGH